MTAQFDLSAALHGAPDGASWMAGTSPAMTQVGTFEQHDVVATNGRARSLALRRPPHRRRLTPSWPGLTRPSTPAPQGARRGRGPERLSFARSSPTRVVDGNDHLGMPMPFAPLPRHPPIKTPPNRPRPTPGRASPRRAPHAVEFDLVVVAALGEGDAGRGGKRWPPPARTEDIRSACGEAREAIGG